MRLEEVTLKAHEKAIPAGLAFDELKARISRREATVAVIGLGYVGLPLATAFSKVGFQVIGVDSDAERVGMLNSGRSYIPDVDASLVQELRSASRFRAADDYDCIREADVVFICVPTPMTASKAADISFIVAAANGIAQRLRRGQLVILQSTTHPGTTQEEVQPILERSGLRAGLDFHLAFCPERINPGDRRYTVFNTPRVVGGLTDRCAQLAVTLFQQLTPEVFVVSSPRAAEMSKLLENTFRAVNIALVNELAKLCERMGIDIWEVIAAASTKPFGYIPFYPGAGVGGHCIAVDPYFLSWKAREYDFYTRFIELAADVNQSMPYHVVERIIDALNWRSTPARGAKVLVLGVAFKRDIDDARNSPAARVIELLLERGAEVSYHDPYVPAFTIGKDAIYQAEMTLKSVPLTEEVLASADCVVIITGHTTIPYDLVVEHASIVVDCCNAMALVAPNDHHKIVRLGAPAPWPTSSW